MANDIEPERPSAPVRPRYSFVVPIFGDGAAAAAFVEDFAGVFRELLGDPREGLEPHVELIFVDDGSPDDSAERIAALVAERPWVRLIELSRNFGHHVALSCGYAHAAGEVVGMLNVDREDPPAEIPRLLAALEESDADLVIGLRRRRGWHRGRLGSVLFTATLNWLTGARAPVDAATLRVMSRRFVDAFNSLEERSRFIPGLEQWLGFEQRYVPIAHRPRSEGASSYSFRRRWGMALDAVISFSDRPLRWLAWTGLGLALVGFLAIAILVATKLSGFDFQRGYPSLVALIVAVGGTQIFVTGVGALYIGRILTEVQRRPLYVVKRAIGFLPQVAEDG